MHNALTALTPRQIDTYDALAKARLQQQRDQREYSTGKPGDAQALACITLLKKLCAHPLLVADELRQKSSACATCVRDLFDVCAQMTLQQLASTSTLRAFHWCVLTCACARD
jgi:SNF2 family DNA or RNA helicase